MNQMTNSRGVARRPAGARFFTGPDYFTISAALLSFLFSVTLWFTGNESAGTFVGLWVPSILAFGIYMKLQLEAMKHG